MEPVQWVVLRWVDSFWMNVCDCVCLLSSVCVGQSLSDFTSLQRHVELCSSWAEHPTEVGLHVTLRLLALLFSDWFSNVSILITKIKTLPDVFCRIIIYIYIFFFYCLLPWGLFIFPLLLLQVHFFAFICTVIILCISGSQILMSSSIIFWFQIKRRRRRDEAASQQALPSTNLTVGNSDLGLVPLHCWSFHYRSNLKHFGLIAFFISVVCDINADL